MYKDMYLRKHIFKYACTCTCVPIYDLYMYVYLSTHDKAIPLHSTSSWPHLQKDSTVPPVYSQPSQNLRHEL